MSASAAAIAIGVVAGSVAAAPVSSTAAAKPATKPAAHAAKKNDPPKISKWQQHIQDMLKVSAPGDEYFGRMKMSYLGINNTFRDDLIRAGAYTTDPHLVSQIEWADDALTSWAKKYPNDPQLARSYFLAFQMYRKVWVQEYQQKAWDYAHIVVKKWPSSFFGKALKKDLAIGFTEHYFATPVACASLPITASPNPHSTATASPSPTPSPTPTPAPGQPKAEVLPVPCLTPTPSPSPIPTGLLTPTPAPGTSASPAPAGSATPVPTRPGTPTPTPATSTSPTPTRPGTPTPTPAPSPTHRP